MPVIIWTGILAIVLPLSAMVYSLVDGGWGSAPVRRNLGRGMKSKDRPAHSGTLDLGRAALRITPRGYVGKLDKLLGLAGRPASLPLPRLLASKSLLGMAGAGIGVLLVLGNLSGRNILVALALTALCYFAPDLLLRSRGEERQKTIALQLPDTLDQMLIAVEAGLGFEAAMARPAANGRGPMAAELARTLQDMQMGRSRREAYQDLANRSSVQELRSFVRAVVQADIYGIGIASVLRVQAQELRLKRRQRAEEHAMKIPVKVLFPLLFCILPALFVVILGPSVLTIINTFSG